MQVCEMLTYLPWIDLVGSSTTEWGKIKKSGIESTILFFKGSLDDFLTWNACFYNNIKKDESQQK